MDYSFFTIALWAVISMLCCMLGTEAMPTFSDVDAYVERSDSEYYSPYHDSLVDYRLSRLRRGYYYVDDGYIAAVEPSAFLTDKRGDKSVTERKDNVQYNPLVSYKQSHTKRKKLFVPNLYG